MDEATISEPISWTIRMNGRGPFAHGQRLILFGRVLSVGNTHVVADSSSSSKVLEV